MTSVRQGFLCEDCGEVKPETFRDSKDGQFYCRECWLEFYGGPPPLQAARSSCGGMGSPGQQLGAFASSACRPSSAVSPPSQEGPDALPEDAPRGHAAHMAVRYNSTHKNPLVSFTWRAGGQRIPFQTTVAAASSRHAAEVIARACYMKFEQGWTKDSVLEFRNQCYAKLKGKHPSGVQQPRQQRPCSQRNSVAPPHERQPLRVVGQDARGAAADAAQVRSVRAVQPQPLQHAPLPRDSAQQVAPAKRQRVEQRCSSSGIGGAAPGSFMPAKYLRLLLDDPHAPLPPKVAEVRCVRSQGSSQPDSLAAAHDEGAGHAAARARRREELVWPRAQEAQGIPHCASASSGSVRGIGASASGSRANHAMHLGPGTQPIAGNNVLQDGKACCTCSCGAFERASGRRHLTSANDRCADAAGQVEQLQEVRGVKRSSQEMDSDNEDEAPPGKRTASQREPEPESQHRPESQPTPFSFGEPEPPAEPFREESLPTPQPEEPTPLPDSQPIPVPAAPARQDEDSLPTPWQSQPTPQLDPWQLQHTVDPTPVPEEKPEPTTPIFSLPTPVPAEFCVTPGASEAAEAEAAEGQGLSLANTAVDGGMVACPAGDSPFPTVSLEMAPAPAIVSKTTTLISAAGQKDLLNFAALLLRRSKEAAAAGKAPRPRRVPGTVRSTTAAAQTTGAQEATPKPAAQSVPAPQVPAAAVKQEPRVVPTRCIGESFPATMPLKEESLVQAQEGAGAAAVIPEAMKDVAVTPPPLDANPEDAHPPPGPELLHALSARRLVPATI
eukprot:gb/GFBE01044129.1/.p1 GENE.gb/GFBE01044129.1/~~gb/GFBE01044129.1/.p1  ORF type:complete len:781 (+),score=122.79 gb/GFBE01044129.1/:1-2343(+)